MLTDRNRQVAAALIEAGSQNGAARLLGVDPRSIAAHRARIAAGDPALSAQVEEALQRRLTPPPAAPASTIDAAAVRAATTPAERHNADFWRRKARALEDELLHIRRLADQLGGIREIRVSIPTWTQAPSGSRGASAVLVHTSDHHMGEVIRAGEVQGVNAFDPDICARRLRRMASAACEIGSRWASDTDCRGAVLTLAGDLISGDIHEELTATQELTAHEQVQASVEAIAAMIRLLVEGFGRVHVVGVPGNHGRTTRRPTAKRYGALSYDILICAMVAREFPGDDRITWQVDGATDQFLTVWGRTLMVTHGDKLGTGGGMGFAGPVLPMLRGGHKVRLQQASLGQAPYLILAGHYHTSAAPPGMLFNGSVPGWSEYGRDVRAGVEPPKQWLALLHGKWGLRERLDVQLEDPAPPVKPRVRIDWGAADA